jgi:nicotinamide mononucleotide transporter
MSFLAWMEAAGFIVTLISIWLLIRQRISGWLWSVLSSIIYIFIYWKARLYSDAELQLMYIGISIYGYISWKKEENNDQLVVKTIQGITFFMYLTLMLTLAFFWGFLHSRVTDASLPYTDALLASSCMIAQWMMARKYFQCWYLWILANIGYIVLYIVKELPATTILYVILFYFTIKGYRDWNRALQKQAISV